MNQKIKVSILVIITLLCVFAMAGCGAIKFKTPTEAKTAQKMQEDATNNTMPADLEVTSNVYENELALPSGAVTAKYHVELPSFKATSEKATIIKKINTCYSDEMESLKQDCESYFAQVQAAYGELWSKSAEPSASYGVRHTFEVIDKSPERISVARTYKYTDVNMQIKYVYSAETFDCATGWPLKLSEVLIADTAKINDAIGAQITKWAADEQIDTSLLAPFDIVTNEYSFALNDSHIYICLDENGISSISPGAYLVKIPREDIAEILINED